MGIKENEATNDPAFIKSLQVDICAIHAAVWDAVNVQHFQKAAIETFCINSLCYCCTAQMCLYHFSGRYTNLHSCIGDLPEPLSEQLLA